MIAEPYICVRGPRAGEIHWLFALEANTSFGEESKRNREEWQRYSDFEREKLDQWSLVFVRAWTRGYELPTPDRLYVSTEVIGYSADDYSHDTESGRLLKRAEFLKAVCEREGVQFLPDVADSASMKTCSIEGCDREGMNGRGNYCWKHYHRIRKYGDPNMVAKPYEVESLEDHVAIRKKLMEGMAVDHQTGCWLWLGAKNYQGYGKMTIKRSPNQSYPTHRLSAMVFLGFDIESEAMICHRCDNPPCLNPEHLFVGDAKTNAEDMVRKGRAVDVSDRDRSDDGTFLPKAA